ncbi:hypothetical protein EDD85DRAFT_794595 [Armillaria nabsnona]|nr:hypothetical protein EDD85DRAFT_794595 [Armillaria nabsnona]
MDGPTDILPLRTENSTNQQSPALLQPSEVSDSEVLVIDTRFVQDCRQKYPAADNVNELFGAEGNFDYGSSDTIAYPNIYQVFCDEEATLLTRCSLVCLSGPVASVERGCFGPDIKYSTRTWFPSAGVDLSTGESIPLDNGDRSTEADWANGFEVVSSTLSSRFTIPLTFGCAAPNQRSSSRRVVDKAPDSIKASY